MHYRLTLLLRMCLFRVKKTYLFGAGTILMFSFFDFVIKSILLSFLISECILVLLVQILYFEDNKSSKMSVIYAYFIATAASTNTSFYKNKMIKKVSYIRLSDDLCSQLSFFLL